MHIRSLRLTKVGPIPALEWPEPADSETSWKTGRDSGGAGWHVLLGDNGSGKSTALRAISLGLLGPNGLRPLRVLPERMVTSGASKARIDLDVVHGCDDRRESGHVVIVRGGEADSEGENVPGFWDRSALNSGWFSTAPG